tara:strand:+ start:2248 stop:3681 length:1434 start_codon:yes stop_codon:yes gene_type:complete
MEKAVNHSTSIRVNTLVYGIGSFSIFAIKFFLVPLYTFYLTEGDLGWFDVVTSTVPMIAVLLGGHVELALLRWLLEKPTRQIQEKVFTNSCILNLLGFTAFSAFFLLVMHFDFLDVSMYTSPLILYFYVSAVWMYTFLKQCIRSIYSAKMFVATDIFFTLLFLSQVIFFVVILDLKITGILLGYALSNTLVLLYWVVYKKLYIYFDWKLLNFNFIKELLKYSLPLVPNTLNLWSINTLVKYFILIYLGIISNGIFAIAFKIGFIIQMINGIFNKAWQDKAISSYRLKLFKQTINPLFQKYFVLFSSMTLGLISSQWIIVNYMIEKGFQEASNYIWLVAIGFFFTGLANFISVIYQCEKNTMAITISSIIANVVLICSALLIINRFSLYGASLAFLIGNLCLFLYRFNHVRRYVKLNVSFGYILTLSFTLFILVYLTIAVNKPMANYAASLIAAIFILRFNFEEIKNILRVVKKRLIT